MGFWNNVQNAVNNAQNAASDAASYREREISTGEYNQAGKVFRDRLPPRTNILISNGLGAQQRPYTVPHPTLSRKYVMHLGPDAYRNANQNNLDIILMHELTHVWQGHHGRSRWCYVCNSVINQARYGSSAYSYTLGQDWSSYNAEQQAQIVEDWYRAGMNERDSDTRWRYIRDNIRGLR